MSWSETDASVLVIGYGNSLRRDDGAGSVLAEALTAKWQEHGHDAAVLTAHQLSPELAEDIAQISADIVLFVDAVQTGAPDRAQIEIVPVSVDHQSPSLGHHLTPAALMLYANRLYAYQGRAWLISVPGFDFDHGEGLTAQTALLIRRCVEDWQVIWGRLHTAPPAGPPID